MTFTEASWLPANAWPSGLAELGVGVNRTLPGAGDLGQYHVSGQRPSWGKTHIKACVKDDVQATSDPLPRVGTWQSSG